jgi:hypothetical protein
MWGTKDSYKISVGKYEGKRTHGRPRRRWRIILKGILINYGVRMLTRFIWLMIDPVADSTEHVNKPSVSTKGGNNLMLFRINDLMSVHNPRLVYQSTPHPAAEGPLSEKLENLKCYRKVRAPCQCFIPTRRLRHEGGRYSYLELATAVPQPLNVREYCPFRGSNIAYSEYIARERDRRNTEMRAREKSYV